jgi:hypothetical protein
MLEPGFQLAVDVILFLKKKKGRDPSTAVSCRTFVSAWFVVVLWKLILKELRI